MSQPPQESNSPRSRSGKTEGEGHSPHEAWKEAEKKLSRLLFHELKKELDGLDDDLTERKAAEMIRDSLRTLPGFAVEPGEKRHLITVSHVNFPGRRVTLNLQDAVDSLMVVWNDYLETLKHS